MYRTLLFLLATSLSSPLLAGEPKPIQNPDRFCEDAKELATITSQIPDYALSWEAETPVAVAPPLIFKSVRRILASARGQPVCIAVIVSETGEALEAAAYFPGRVSLTKEERDEVLANRFEPAKQAGTPIKSVMVMKAWLD